MLIPKDQTSGLRLVLALASQCLLLNIFVFKGRQNFRGERALETQRGSERAACPLPPLPKGVFIAQSHEVRRVYESGAELSDL